MFSNFSRISSSETSARKSFTGGTAATAFPTRRRR